MKLEQQVISLALAERLYRLFVNQQEAQFYWSYDTRKQPRKDGTYKARLISKEQSKRILTRHVYMRAAFTVAELGEKIGHENRYSMPKWDGFHKKWYSTDGPNDIWLDTPLEAEARGLMLAYLVENKLITV